MDESVAMGYSSCVRLGLDVGGYEVPLAKIGPSFVVLVKAQDLPAGTARIVMDIDGQTRIWPVTLPHGAVPFDEMVQVREID